MTIRNTTRRWGVIAQLLHWLVVVLIIAQFCYALKADGLPLAQKIAPIATHKSIGITILLLVCLRLGWRWANPTPALPSTLKPYERALARGTHFLLYALLFLTPLAGWTMSSARGFPVSWFGFIQLPDFVPKNHALYEKLLACHEILAWTLTGVVALHVGAAMKHHFLLKDDVLRRMLPATKPQGSEP